MTISIPSIRRAIFTIYIMLKPTDTGLFLPVARRRSSASESIFSLQSEQVRHYTVHSSTMRCRFLVQCFNPIITSRRFSKMVTLKNTSIGNLLYTSAAVSLSRACFVYTSAHNMLYLNSCAAHHVRTLSAATMGGVMASTHMEGRLRNQKNGQI